jgi:hypothetical protein
MSSIQNIPGDEQFRDKISTVDKSGKRIWVYPKKPTGKFTNYRIWLSYLYFIILFGLPFIKVNGEPICFNKYSRKKFYIVWNAFWATRFLSCLPSPC